MYIIPFGEVKENRFEACKERGYIEMIAGIWRLTDKCKKRYEVVSMFKYLQGKIKQPKVNSEQSSKKALIKQLLEM